MVDAMRQKLKVKATSTKLKIRDICDAKRRKLMKFKKLKTNKTRTMDVRKNIFITFLLIFVLK